MASALPDDALVCRGGTCLAARFEAGSGVSVSADGKLNGLSVNCGAGKTLEQLTHSIANQQVGVSTVGAIRAAGGEVIPAPNSRNHDHCVMSGITAQQAEILFTPTVLNPSRENN